MFTLLKRLIHALVFILFIYQTVLASTISVCPNVNISEQSEYNSYNYSNDLSFQVDATIFDLNGNTFVQNNIDSLNICNLDYILLELIDQNSNIDNVEWFDENGNLISTEKIIKLKDGVESKYQIRVSNPNCVESKSINIFCNDIDITLQEIVDPDNASGVRDFNGDGKLDFCLGNTYTLTINNLDTAQQLSYNWLGASEFIIGGKSTANPTIYGAAEGNYSLLLITSNQYGCIRRDQFNFSVNAITDLAIQATSYDDLGILVRSETADSIFTTCMSSGTIVLSETATSTNGNVEIKWLDQNGLLLGTEPFIQIPLVSGATYSVTLEDEFGCFSTKSIKIIGKPVQTNIIDAITGEILIDQDGDLDLDYCLNLDKPLIVVSNEPDDSLSYLWTGDIISDGAHTASPILSPPTAGNYFLNLAIENQFGCTEYYVLDLEIYDFSATPEINHRQECNSLEVTVSTSSFNYEFYSWLFVDKEGSKTIKEGNTTSFAYSSPGQYSILLIPDPDLLCDLDTIVKMVDVIDNSNSLQFDFEYLNCSEDRLTIQFRDQTNLLDAQIISRLWSFSGGTFSTSLKPLVTISEKGIFTATLEITSISNCTQTLTKELDIDFFDSTLMKDSIYACYAEPGVALNSDPQIDVQYSWAPNPYFEDLDNPNPVIAPITNTSFEVTLYKEFPDYTCMTNKVISVFVEDEITAVANIQGADSNAIVYENESLKLYTCAPIEPIRLIASVVENGVYNWYSNPSLDPQSLLFSGRTLEITNGFTAGDRIYLQIETENCQSNLFTIEIVVQENPQVLATYDYTPSQNCEPSALSFILDASISPSPIVSYSWSGPNDFISDFPSPSFNTSGFENNGDYILTVLNQAGCSNTYTVKVDDIVPPLIPDPVISSSGITCEGEKVILSTDKINGASVAYQWTFPSTVDISGQGTHEITIDPLDESIHLGEYSVQIFADSCTSTIAYFSLEPIISLRVNSDPICQGGDLTLELDAPLGSAFKWTGPNNFTSSTKSPSIYNVDESYNGLYSVVVENSIGCLAKKEVLVNTIFPDVETPLLFINGPICNGDELSLTTDVEGEWYEWIGPLGSNTGIASLETTTPFTNIPTWSDAYLSGGWKLRITDKNGCTAISDPISVGINEIPISEILGDDFACDGGTLKLYASTVPDAKYEWYTEAPSIDDIPDFTTQSIEIPSVQAGLYLFYLQVTVDGCPSEWSMKSILIENSPSVIAEHTILRSPDCSQNNIVFTTDASGSSPFTYLWTGPNNFSSTEASPVIQNADLQDSGSYSVEVRDAQGCIASQVNVEVGDMPMILIPPTIHVSGLRCKGEELKLEVQDYENEAVTYTWSSPTNQSVSTDMNSNILVISSFDDVHEGIYAVEVQLDDCMLQSEQLVLKMEDTPTVLLDQTNNIICEGEQLLIESTGTNIAAYQWTGPNNFSASTMTASIENVSSQNNGRYTLLVHSPYGCFADSEILVDNILTSSVPVLEAIDICEGEPLILSSSSAGVRYEWIPPIGQVNQSEFSTDLSTTTGELSIASNELFYLPGEWRVKVTDANGCESISLPLQIDFYPAVPIELVGGGTYCENETIHLATSAQGESFEWTLVPTDEIGSSIISVVSSTNVLTIDPSDPSYQEGEWTVLSTVESGCFLSSNAISINIQDIPIAEASNDGPYCAVDRDIQLIANTVAGASYSWYEGDPDNGGTLISTVQNPMISGAITNEGDAYYLVISHGECTSTPSVTIPMYSPLPNTDLTVDYTVLSDCSIEEFQLIANVDVQSSYDYLWSGPNGFISTLASPIISDLENTEVEERYSLLLTDSNGCTSTSDVMVNPKTGIETPSLEFSVDKLCAGGSVWFTATTYVGQEVSYEWTTPQSVVLSNIDPASNEFEISNIQPLDEGFYSVRVYVDGCLSDASEAIFISVDQTPTVQSPEEYNVCAGQTDPLILNTEVCNGLAPYVYQWAGPNGYNSNEASPIFTEFDEDVAGVYTLSILDANGCIANLTSVQINVHPEQETPIIQPILDNLCEGSSLSLSIDNYTESYEYIWTFGDGSSTITIEPNLTIDDLQIETHHGPVRVFANINSCSSNTSEEILLSIGTEPDTPNLYNSTLDNIICEGGEVELGTEFYNNAVYEWLGPNGFYSNEQSPLLSNVSLAGAGLYTLTVVIDGCISPISQTEVKINPLLEAPILIASSEKVCLGEGVSLTLENYTDMHSYVWTMADGSIIETTDPNLIIAETILGVHDGQISVYVDDPGCTSASSNNLVLDIVRPPDALMISNTTEEGIACHGENIQLMAPDLAGANYHWLGPNDFYSAEQNPILLAIDIDDSGIYTLTVEVDGCTSPISETEVRISLTPVAPMIEHIDTVCEGSEAILRVQNPEPELLYKWYKGLSNEKIGEGPMLILPAVSLSNAGAYYAVCESESCTSVSSMESILSVESAEAFTAYAGEDQVSCSPEYLLGQNIGEVQEGFWGQEDGEAIILNPMEHQTWVADLVLGQNEFLWTLTNTVCLDNAADTMTVLYVPLPIAEDDRYSTKLNTGIINRVLENDITNTTDITVSLSTKPLHGMILQTQTGTFEYFPDNNYIGEDHYVYTLCNDNCLEDCVEATVFINIGDERNCFVPSIFTPNDDGINDSFTIPFLTNFSQSKVYIYNRWGDEVYFSDNYKNDWKGTYKERSLPSGTYFYILEVNDEDQTKKTGYIFIER